MEEIRFCIASNAGLSPPEWVLQARVKQRMAALGLTEISAYADRVGNSSELDQLVALLRVGETSFFRHRAQLESLQTSVLPTFHKHGEPVRVWSAGCASGEEAYTLAMILDKGLARNQKYHVLGSDISPSSLEVASAGIYSLNKQELPSEFHRYFVPVRESSTDQSAIHPDIRDQVHFDIHNLADDKFPASFDLIFCRNVLIYFTPAAKKRVVEKLVASLKPGGYLFLGYSESLRGVKGLKAEGAQGARVYRRATPQSQQPSVAPRQKPAPIASTPGQPANAPSHQPASTPSTQRLRLSGEYNDGKRMAIELRSVISLDCPTIEVLLDEASYLGSEAAEEMQRALAANANIVFIASRSGHLRFLRRHGLLTSAEDKR
ncbi:MAG: methyltransferase domain-containing protein [Kofleriaceae bacterium]|nr:methyltransferase domain-containing protein [Kofleriaceae bacterium]